MTCQVFVLPLFVNIQLIPYRRLSLNTRLSVEQTMSLLQESVAPVPSISLRWTSKATKPFEGTVSPTGFTIFRTIRYRNSFLPILNGRFAATPTGTVITVNMTISPLVAAVGLLMIMSLGPILLSALARQFDLGLALLLLGIYVVMMIAFGYEANRAEAQLKQIFGPYLA